MCSLESHCSRLDEGRTSMSLQGPKCEESVVGEEQAHSGSGG